MAGGIEVSIPFQTQNNQIQPGKAASFRFRIWSDARSFSQDALTVWDAFAVFLSGVGAAFLMTSFGSGDASIQPYDEPLAAALVRCSGLGAAFTPLLLRHAAVHMVDAAALQTLFRRVALLIGSVLAVAFGTGLLGEIPHAWLLAWFAGAFAASVAGRLVTAKLLRPMAAERLVRDRVAVVGFGADADWLRAAFEAERPFGLELVGPSRPLGSVEEAVADLLERGRRGELDRVVLAPAGLDDADIRRIAHQLKALQVEVASLRPLLGAGRRLCTTVIADIPLFLVAPRPQQGYGGLSKELLDRALALGLLLWTLPVLLAIALAIRLESPGPVLFRQRRHGINGTEFEIYKFRTMVWAGQGAGSGAVQTGRRDRRVTRVGALLRKTSFDEVPQLLNVLNGTMSLVGPRPHPTVMRTEQRLGGEIVADYPHRHRVKPGITGWAQVNGLRGATETAEQLRRRVEHDNFYIENWSPWFDLKILLLTPFSLLLRRNNAF